MVIGEIINMDVFVFKNNQFSFEEEGKKEENSTALEDEETGPNPKVESPQ